MSVSLADIVKYHTTKVQADADRKTAQIPQPVHMPYYFRTKIIGMYAAYKPVAVYTPKYSS